MPEPPGIPTNALMVALVVASVALPSMALAPAAAAQADGYLYLTSTTTPDQPTTNGEFTFTTTFQRSEAGSGPVEVERITLTEGTESDADVLAERRFLRRPNPTLASEETVAQDFSIEFDEPGTHEVVVELQFRAPDGSGHTVSYRTNVTVYGPNPRIEMNAAPTTAGERTSLNVSVANGLEDTIRDVDLAIEGEDVSFDENERVASSIAGGETRSFGFTVTPASLGMHAVDVDLAYTDANGTRRQVTRTVDVRFRAPDLDGDLGVSADVAPAMPGAETTMNLTLANGLDRSLRQFEVQVEAEGVSFQQRRRVGTGFQSGAQRAFSFDVSRPDSGTQPVDVTVTYTTANGIEGQVTETLETTFSAPSNPGEVRLTGVDAVTRGGSLEVSATASNVGSTDVEAVVVSVADSSAVAGADYFVGGIESSDFATFTLTTGVTGNVSSVPVEVSYVVDGVEQTLTSEVSVDQTAAQMPDGNTGGNSSGLQLVVIVVLAVVLGVVAVIWRRRG